MGSKQDQIYFYFENKWTKQVILSMNGTYLEYTNHRHNQRLWIHKIPVHLFY